MDIKRSVAATMRDLSRSSRATKKFIKILNDLIENEDFITFFSIAQAFEELSTKNIKFPDKLRESRNFRKYSLFDPSGNLPLIELDILVRDNDQEIKEIAIQIKKHELLPLPFEFTSPLAIFFGIDSLLILATKNNSDLAYFDTSSMNTDIVEYIRAVKNSDLPEDSKMFAIGGSIKVIIGGRIIVPRIIIDGTCPKFTLEDYEKIVNTFRNEWNVLYSISGRLRSFFRRDKLSADDFSKTDDPVISLLNSYIQNEEPSESIIDKSIEIFREEKNVKNKRALFNLLHHFSSPFARGISAVVEIKCE